VAVAVGIGRCGPQPSMGAIHQAVADDLAALEALEACSGNKSTAAARLGASRPAFYRALQKITDLTGEDLDDPEVRLGFHLALVVRGHPAGPRDGTGRGPGRRAVGPEL